MGPKLLIPNRISWYSAQAVLGILKTKRNRLKVTGSWVFATKLLVLGTSRAIRALGCPGSRTRTGISATRGCQPCSAWQSQKTSVLPLRAIFQCSVCADFALSQHFCKTLAPEQWLLVLRLQFPWCQYRDALTENKKIYQHLPALSFHSWETNTITWTEQFFALYLHPMLILSLVPLLHWRLLCLAAICKCIDTYSQK